MTAVAARPPDRAAPAVSTDVAVYPAGPRSAGAARRHAVDVTHGWGVSADTAETVRLVVSELVTNAVAAADRGGHVAVRLSATSHLAVEVWDGGSGAPAVAETADDLAESGRGLLIVESLSRRWGAYHPPEGGTVVWAVLPDEPPPRPPTQGGAEPAVPLGRRSPEAIPSPLTPVGAPPDDVALLQRVVDRLRALDGWYLAPARRGRPSRGRDAGGGRGGDGGDPPSPGPIDVIVRRGDGSWAARSPQCPGLVVQQPSAVEPREAMPAILSSYFGDGPGGLEVRFHLEDELRGVVVRVAQDAHQWERQHLADRVNAALGDPEQAEKLRSRAASDSLDEIVVVCALPHDTVQWVVSQLDPGGDLVNVALPVADGLVRVATYESDADGHPGRSTLAEVVTAEEAADV